MSHETLIANNYNRDETITRHCFRTMFVLNSNPLWTDIDFWVKITASILHIGYGRVVDKDPWGSLGEESTLAYRKSFELQEEEGKDDGLWHSVKFDDHHSTSLTPTSHNKHEKFGKHVCRSWMISSQQRYK